MAAAGLGPLAHHLVCIVLHGATITSVCTVLLLDNQIFTQIVTYSLLAD